MDKLDGKVTIVVAGVARASGRASPRRSQRRLFDGDRLSNAERLNIATWERSHSVHHG